MEWWPTTACTPRAPVYTPDGPTIIAQSLKKETRLDQVVERREIRAEPSHGVSWGEAFRVWLRVAALSFGGPAGQIAVMHRILVEEKRWISESRFLHALNYCMLLPGPEAQQLATYVGWLMHRTLGGIMAGGLFILPGIVAIMALSWIYALYGKVGIVSALFFGLKAAVLAVVLEAVVRIGRKSLKNGVMVGIAAAAFVAIFFMKVPFPIIILLAGLIGFLGGRAGLRAFDVGGGHGASPGKDAPLVDALLGDELPAHARPTVAEVAPGRRPCGLRSGSFPSSRSSPRSARQRVQPDRDLLLQDGDGDLRRRLRGSGLRRPAGGRELRLAGTRRDAGRARHGRDDAGAAHHGAAVRRLHGRLPRPGRPQPARSPARSAASSPPG